jgi:hypothetical protein
MRRTARLVAVLTASILCASCATSFSPADTRAEIARQTGADPPRVLEFNLGTVTMALARQVIGPGADGSLPLGGLTRIEVAVYDVPAGGTALDFTRMAVRGWEPTVRARTPTGSTLVLVRASGDSIGDLVLVAADARQVLYSRPAGRLSRELPVALGQAVSSRRTEGVKQELMSLTGKPDPAPNS